MKYKPYHFDVELIIDHEIEFMGKKENIATHHTVRGISFNDLKHMIKINECPKEDTTKITFIIRGVNF